jgi:hypothetical protein
MNEDMSFLLKHRGKGALLDANLLLVYVVGKTHPGMLRDCHYTKQYQYDLPLIERVVEWFSKIYTTPNVLTEVSNLGGKLGCEFFDTLGNVVTLLNERYCPSKEASGYTYFRTVGLTDAGLCMIAAEHLVVTADYDLYQILRKNNVDAVNFNHLRPLAWEGFLL